MRLRKVIATLVAAGLLFGCADMNKEQVGTALGALAGAFVGNKMGGDRGMAIGMALGGMIGNRIGAQMDEQDRQKLAVLERHALDTGNSGSFVTNKTKANITVDVSPARLDRQQRFVLSSSIKPQALVAIDPYTVQAYVDTPVYTVTDESSPPKMVVQHDVPVQVSANVVGGNWVVIGESNVGIGYVPLRYLRPEIVAELRVKERSQTAAAAPAKAASKTGSTKVAAKTSKIPATPVASAKTSAGVTPSSTSGSSPSPLLTSTLVRTGNIIGKDQYLTEVASISVAAKVSASAPTGNAAGSTTVSTLQPTIQVVQASTECKVVSRKVDAGPSNQFVEQVKYCKEPPKGWQTQTA